MAKRGSKQADTAPGDHSIEIFGWPIVAFMTVVIPLFFWAGADPFRLPKRALFLVLALLLFVALAAVLRREEWQEIRRKFAKSPELKMVLLVLGWTAISAAFATNRRLSAVAVIWMAACCLFFAVVYLAAPRKSVRAMFLALVPAVMNAALITMQEADIWNPLRFAPDVTQHQRSAGLLGNPDYVGCLLVGAVLISAGLFVISRSTAERVALTFVTSVLIAGIISSHSFTAFVALAVGSVVFVVLSPYRKVSLAVAVVVVVIAATVYKPVRTRLTAQWNTLRSAQAEVFFSGRLGAFLTAWEMFKDHPVLGVGPGCFKFEYFDYRIRVQAEHARLLQLEIAGVNFGETHNDHLQTLAETGLPGYALFIAGAALMIRAGLRCRGETDDPRRLFTRFTAIPFSTAFLVLAAGQFPMHLTSVSTVSLFVTALCTSWSGPSDEVT